MMTSVVYGSQYLSTPCKSYPNYLDSECFPGKWRMRPLHSVAPDLPTCPRHLTRSPMGHGWSPALFPSGYRTHTAGERHTRAPIRRESLFLHFLSSANDPWRYYSPHQSGACDLGSTAHNVLSQRIIASTPIASHFFSQKADFFVTPVISLVLMMIHDFKLGLQPRNKESFHRRRALKIHRVSFPKDLALNMQ